MENYAKLEAEHVNKLTQAMELIKSVLEGEQMEKPEPKEMGTNLREELTKSMK
jgi:hypothetical protein